MSELRTTAANELMDSATKGSWQNWAGDPVNLPGLRRELARIEAEAAEPGLDALTRGYREGRAAVLRELYEDIGEDLERAELIASESRWRGWPCANQRDPGGSRAMQSPCASRLQFSARGGVPAPEEERG